MHDALSQSCNSSSICTGPCQLIGHPDRGELTKSAGDRNVGRISVACSRGTAGGSRMTSLLCIGGTNTGSLMPYLSEGRRSRPTLLIVMFILMLNISTINMPRCTEKA